ncbi:MAG: hypothetical protein HFJ30_03550 [Clostridia bacterium]|nr:hypothetical protein [Clostridia bacterium]MCI9413407.1 hypothetical protein [Clostridia bacterium]
MKKQKKRNKEKGITLVALVVTIVVLLILAGITLTYVLGDNSIFKQASNAKLKTEIAKAREKIEVVLTTVQVEKRTNIKYNENDFLDTYILNEIQDAEIIDDIVIIDGYAFELDRSVPKLGKYLGKKEELVFPSLTVSAPVLAENSRLATFTITAKEEKNGIHKIEIIQEGHVIKEYEYSNRKDEIIENCSVKQNGKYTIKVYAELSAIELITVDGIVMSVEYSPNGNEEYQKEHPVKVEVKETDDKVKSIKYQWLNTTVEPTQSSFIENCSNYETIIGKGYTGTYYLWTLLETESGKTNICRSEGFNFDNEGPTITNFTAEKYSETGITLSVTAEDTKAGIVKVEFYVDNVLRDTQTCSATTLSVTKSKTITDLSTGSHSCMVKVYDAKGNTSDQSVSGTTKLYVWEKWSSNPIKKYTEKRSAPREMRVAKNALYSCPVWKITRGWADCS